MATLYTVYKCKSMKDDSQKGHFHASDDAIKTLCDKYIDEKWFICDNTFTGTITCPKCKKIDVKTTSPERSEKNKSHNP